MDIICEKEDDSEVLFVQSHYSTPDVNELNSVLSKWENYEAERTGQSFEAQALPLPGILDLKKGKDVPTAHYLLVTVSDLNTIIPRYERTRMSSKRFYDIMKGAGRLHIVHGRELLPLLTEAYKRQFFTPTDITLHLAQPYISMGDVYIGIISGEELKRLHASYGDALFLQNIREYKGLRGGRVAPESGGITVNEAIHATLTDNPDRFLARNNGITFGASRVAPLDDKTLFLDVASIVNGGQTTRVIVDTLHEGSYVTVKVVQTPDAWDIAEAANFQNEIKQLDLRLAKHIRPQKMREIASKYNVRFKGEGGDANSLVETLYEEEITYDQAKRLFLAFFSTTPTNAISANYTQLKGDIVSDVFRDEEVTYRVFNLIFDIHRLTQEAARIIAAGETDEQTAALFKRFWADGKNSYRAFLAALAACGCLNQNIYAHSGGLSYEALMAFLSDLQSVVEVNPELFIRYFDHAFTAVALEVLRGKQSMDKMLRDMYYQIQRADFPNLFRSVGVLGRHEKRNRP